jgi:OOP family OmpA-OmpF porin
MNSDGDDATVTTTTHRRTTTVREGSPRRSAAAVLGAFLAGAIPLVTVASLVSVPQIEDELTDKSLRAASDLGLSGIVVDFSGQDGTVQCAQPLPSQARDDLRGAIEEIRGVRVARIGTSCGTGTDQAAAATTTTPPAAAPTTTQPTVAPVFTVADVIASDPQFSTLAGLLESTGLDEQLRTDGPFTIFAPNNDAFAAIPEADLAALADDPEALSGVLLRHVVAGAVPAASLVDGPLDTAAGDTVNISIDGDVRVDDANVLRPDITADNGIVHGIDAVLLPAVEAPDIADATVTYDDGRIVLSGTVGTEQQRQALVDAAARAVAPENVVDNLAVDAAATVGDDEITGLTTLIGGMVPNLVNGQADVAGTELRTSGVFLDDAGRAAYESLAADAGADVTLEARPDGAACDTDGLASQLTALLAEQPINFAPGLADIPAASQATLDRVAVVAKECTGVLITVQGHTDSDGNEATNLDLSARRAQAVVEALVQRAVPATQVIAQGFGETQLLPAGSSAGTEDKALSRRVDFAVAVN